MKQLFSVGSWNKPEQKSTKNTKSLQNALQNSFGIQSEVMTTQSLSSGGIKKKKLRILTKSFDVHLLFFFFFFFFFYCFLWRPQPTSPPFNPTLFLFFSCTITNCLPSTSFSTISSGNLPSTVLFTGKITSVNPDKWKILRDYSMLSLSLNFYSH